MIRATIATLNSQHDFCSIDGVLKAGEQVLPEAKRALKVLEGNNARKTRIPYIFITNGGGPSETTRAQKLSKELGVEVSPFLA